MPILFRITVPGSGEAGVADAGVFETGESLGCGCGPVLVDSTSLLGVGSAFGFAGRTRREVVRAPEVVFLGVGVGFGFTITSPPFPWGLATETGLDEPFEKFHPNKLSAPTIRQPLREL